MSRSACACVVGTLVIVLAQGGCFAMMCPLALPLDLIQGSMARDAASNARSHARSREVRAQTENDQGRDDWPCPPNCRSGYVCVRSELVGHGICRPRCDLVEVDLCDRPALCTPVTGAEPACVDATMVGTNRPQAEPVTPPPPLLDP